MFLKGFSAAMEEHKSKGAFKPGASNTRLRQVKLETATGNLQIDGRSKERLHRANGRLCLSSDGTSIRLEAGQELCAC